MVKKRMAAEDKIRETAREEAWAKVEVPDHLRQWPVVQPSGQQKEEPNEQAK
jgi:hypothetical protein